jgi:hypothetical protein
MKKLKKKFKKLKKRIKQLEKELMWGKISETIKTK